MVGAVHDVRLRDGWERQCGDSAVGGADRLIFNYCRHLDYLHRNTKEGKIAM
jgi:hypothetical protein